MSPQQNDQRPRRYREHDVVRHSYPTVQQRQMANEWVQLNRTPSTGALLVGWSTRRAALRGMSRPGDVLDVVDSAPVVVRDAILLALISEFHDGASLAGRIVLQAMLPKLSGFALRGQVSLGGLDERFQRVVADFWEVLCVYPTTRRPTRVAANLALDTLNRLSRQGRQNGIEVAVDPAELVPWAEASVIQHPDVVAGVNSDWSLSELLSWATAQGWVKPQDAELLQQVYGAAAEETASRVAISAAYAAGARRSGESTAALRQRAHRARKQLTDAVRAAQRAELLG